MLRTAALLCVLAAATTARADDPPSVATYAIVVGSNAGGPGQVTLHYAEEDARRVAAVLGELGGYAAGRIDIVLHPTPDQLRARLSELRTHVAADLAAGRQSQLFFYYSGHARASAIDLGNDELPLEELRARLFEIPATLTVVVLDACQSGAFSRIKGAQPAADFSFNSRQHLDATGIAVLASSSGSELSQENEELKSSYFTHHLLVGLRGAGDANGDGQVSIDEAYRYAYHQTLLATSETAVGGQHVTFEADLKGHGDVPLSFPRAATASIGLPASLEGKTLVEYKRAHAVVAETYKAKGVPVRIAVAPGDYEVHVRQDTVTLHCDVAAPGDVDLARCRAEPIVRDRVKGRWGATSQQRLELGVLVGPERSDAYTQNLANFGYTAGSLSSGFTATALRRVSDEIWIGANAQYLAMPEWTNYIVGGNGSTEVLDSSTTTLAATARAEQRLGQATRWSFYAQASAGVAIGHTLLTNASGEHFGDSYVGPALAGGLGFHVHLGRVVGLTWGYEYSYAPVIQDLIGNTHASGGSRLVLALTFGS